MQTGICWEVTVRNPQTKQPVNVRALACNQSQAIRIAHNLHTRYAVILKVRRIL